MTSRTDLSKTRAEPLSSLPLWGKQWLSSSSPGPIWLELKTRQVQPGGGKEQNLDFFGAYCMPAALWAEAHELQKMALGGGRSYCSHFMDGKTASEMFRYHDTGEESLGSTL